MVWEPKQIPAVILRRTGRSILHYRGFDTNLSADKLACKLRDLSACWQGGAVPIVLVELFYGIFLFYASI